MSVAHLGNAARQVRWLQAATGVSAFGSRISELALPLVALTVLDSTAFEVGALSSAALIPNLVLGVPAGTWIEAMRPRRLMLVCDAGRAAVLLTIPLAFMAGLLTFLHLLLAALVVGCLTVFSDLASTSYLPRLVGLDQLVAARSRQVSLMQSADVAGRPLAGMLIGIAGAARAVTGDAMTYLVSFLFVRRLPELEPTGADPRATFLSRLREGASFAWSNTVNRRIVLEGAHYNVFYQAFIVGFMVHAAAELHWSPTQIGIALGASSLGAVVGSELGPKLASRIGIGPTILRALLVADAATILVPTFIGDSWLAFAAVCLTFAVMGAGSLLSGVVAGTLNRAVTPENVYSRVLGANRVLTRGGTALGGLLGGLLLTVLTPHVALFICAGGMCVAVGWVLSPQITSVKSLDDAKGCLG
ncbi:MAG: MFS transporter [Nocardioides sp.]|uniref:MFS transporter n=1 Tax=Nocardioides sp. TaxID=35761 RepID=UPI0039E69CD3